MRCDPGFVDCDGNANTGCETSTDLSSLHETVTSGDSSGGGGCGGGAGGEVVGTIGTCNIVCELGWIDCDQNHANGCETKGYACPSPFTDASPFGDASVDAGETTAILALKNDPRGLVACNGMYYVLDGPDVRAIDPKTLVAQTIGASPNAPSGGLACDGAHIYWAIASDLDASTPNGLLLRMDLSSLVIDLVASGVDPGAGVDVRGSSAYFIARSGVDDAGPTLAAVSLDDGGLLSWMPVSETAAYKAFAFSSDGAWSLANGFIYRRPDDAGPFAWLDASGASALVANEQGDPFAVVHVLDDAGTDAQSEASTSHDYFASLVDDDAGVASLAPVDGSIVDPIVTTAPGVAASTGLVYAVRLPDGGATLVSASGGITSYVAADANWVVWATRSNGTGPGIMWRAPRP